MDIRIPEYSLIILVGASSAGKSSFARKHFLSTEVISSDHCRQLVSDDENQMDASTDAFELLHFIAGKRMKRGLRTVIDATNVKSESRKTLVSLAKKFHYQACAIVLNLPEEELIKRHKEREDRNFPIQILKSQIRNLKRSFRHFKKDGFHKVYELKSQDAVDQAQIKMVPLKVNRTSERGPFDLIGDVHGCYDELVELLNELGYEEQEAYHYLHPEGRKLVFVGDLVDRGPKSPDVLRMVMTTVAAGHALCVPGNHDVKLVKKLRGRKVSMKHGIVETMEQLEGESPEFLESVAAFIDGLPLHYQFDDGKLVIAHAGIKEHMQGRVSGTIRAFCLYGDVDGTVDSFNMPVRHNWAKDYRGEALVVYGHVCVAEAQWVNQSVDIDTGCVFGGKLTALRYPEIELVSVPAKKTYSEPSRPFLPLTNDQSLQQEFDTLLDISDYLGTKAIQTRYRKRISIKEEQSRAALELMSRFAIDPKWLIYLPPTMSPPASSHEVDYLEHPKEAFAYYQKQQIKNLICEKKHMGSRAIVVLCQDEVVARDRFGIQDGSSGVVYTRSGRAFFEQKDLEKAFLNRLREALTKSAFWEKHQTNWLCLDCELLPWSAKAQGLIQSQYAATAAAGDLSLKPVLNHLQKAMKDGRDVAALTALYTRKQNQLQAYSAAYKQYCANTDGLTGIQLAPFHILATEGQVHTDKNHLWHMEEIHSICASDPEFLLATDYLQVNMEAEKSIQKATDWWKGLCETGGEGMVVKPMDFIPYSRNGLIQPAIKVRGQEYLRIIYGPEYLNPSALKRLKNRNLNHKRSLALREFQLGLEALNRFIEKSPLRMVHECVFAILAMESEPVDPRL